VNSFDELEVNPKNARINGESKQAFTISFKSSTPKEFN